MQNSANLYFQLINKLTVTNLYPIIYEKQQKIYDLLPYKIQQNSPEKMQKIYNNILEKYHISHQLKINAHNWHQNERRVFVWFIISYNYFLELKGTKINEDTWNALSPVFFDKSPAFLHFQYLNLLKSKNRIKWTNEDDQILISCINQQKFGRWNEISKRIFYDSERRLFRSPKHCRERWLNHLDDKKKRGEWTTKEQYIIFKFYVEHGKKWSRIVPLLNESRTEHMIKNRFNSLINKARTGRKQRQQEIAKKVLKQLKERNKSEIASKQKSIQFQNESIVQVPQQLQNMREHIENSPNTAININSSFMFFSQSIPINHYQYITDLNYSFLMNPMFNVNNNFYEYSLSFYNTQQNEENLNFSQKSNFRICENHK